MITAVRWVPSGIPVICPLAADVLPRMTSPIAKLADDVTVRVCVGRQELDHRPARGVAVGDGRHRISRPR
jgi:hypothetical protein